MGLNILHHISNATTITTACAAKVSVPQESWAYGPNLVWGGGGTVDRFAYTVHIYNFVRDFIRAFFKDGGEGIF